MIYYTTGPQVTLDSFKSKTPYSEGPKIPQSYFLTQASKCSLSIHSWVAYAICIFHFHLYFCILLSTDYSHGL